MTLMTWKFAITPDRKASDIARGYVRAVCEGHALSLLDHPSAQVWPCPEKVWPGQRLHFVHWIFDPLGLSRSELLEELERKRDEEMRRLLSELGPNDFGALDLDTFISEVF